jgi:hypothetical protein
MARTTWWSSEWARWFGWTVVFALVAGACTLAYEVSIGCKSWPKGLPVVADACGLASQALGPGILPAWSLAYLVPPLVAAFFIGVRFPFRWWLLGPPVAVFLVGTPLLLIPYYVVASLVPESLFQDTTLTYGEAMVVALLFLLFGMTIFLILLALVAHAGVRWGRRREGTHSR